VNFDGKLKRFKKRMNKKNKAERIAYDEILRNTLMDEFNKKMHDKETKYD
jgi:hypothetical protein